MCKYLLAFVAAALAAPLLAQPSAPAPTATPPTASARIPFVKSEAEAVVQALATQLDDNFVFPDVAKQYAAMLRANLAAGKYDSFPDAQSFARAVTDDLQAIHKDGHLALHAPKKDASGQRQVMKPLGPESGLVKSGWLAPGVAYVRFDLFPGNDATMADIRSFLENHKSAKTLIIDARHHHGGGLGEMGLMFPYLFAAPTVLVDMDTRQAAAADDPVDPSEAGYVRTVHAPVGLIRREHFVVPAKNAGSLQRATIYLLTSRETGSAAEHLALSLKRTHRATLIGERTHGAGHYGGIVPLGYGYSAFIPIGRTFDPKTNEDWEGVGIKPDIEVPADEALDEALKRAGVRSTAQVALAKLY